METGVVNTGNLQQTANASVEDTLNNLGVEIEKNLPTLNNTSEADNSSQKPENSATAPDTQVEPPQKPAKSAEADEATKHRYAQENSKLRAVLAKFGVNADSDIIDQLQSGLITVDDVLRINRIQSPQQPQVDQPQSAQDIPLEQKVANLTNALAEQNQKRQSGQELYANDFLKVQDQLIEVVNGVVQVNQNLVRQQETNTTQQKFEKITTAVNNVYGQSLKSSIPEEVQDIGAQAFLGFVELANIDLVKQVGPDRAMTPEGYSHTAKRAVDNFNKFIQAVYKAGQTAATKGITTSKPGINPMQPGMGQVTSPVPQNKNKFDLNNLDSNVGQFLASAESRV